MSLIVRSGATSDELTVDATSKAARVSLYDTSGNHQLFADGADITNAKAILLGGDTGPSVRNLRVTTFGNLRPQDSIVFAPHIEGSTLNSVAWTSTVATMTTTQATGQITMNANNTTTTTTSAVLTSVRQMPLNCRASTVFRARARPDWRANQVIEIGLGAFTGTTALTANTIHFRITSGGSVEGVITVNSTEKTVSLGTFGSGVWTGADAKYFSWNIYVDDDSAHFIVTNPNTSGEVASGVVLLDDATPRVSTLSHLPVAFRIYNATAPATAGHLYIAAVTCSITETDACRIWSHVQAGRDLGAVMSPTAFTQLANYANSAAPTSATLSNTAAGYTTLGGQWQFAAVAGAETDYALFAFTVPAPYNLYVTSVRIDATVTGAAVATTPTLLQWGLADSAAVTLASNTNRIALGLQSFAVGAAVGSTADKTLIWTPGTPFVIRSGRICHGILKMPVGTATASSVIRGTFLFEGYFELGDSMAHVIIHGGPLGGTVVDAPSDTDGTEFEHEGGLYRVNAELQAIYTGKTQAARDAEAAAALAARRAEIEALVSGG